MDSNITWSYQIADHNCRITWVYNKKTVMTCSPSRYNISIVKYVYRHKGRWYLTDHISMCLLFGIELITQ